jgi:hypothetical protein
MIHITILYAHEDGTLASQLAELLQQQGYHIAYTARDQEEPHHDLSEQIKICDRVLLLWSRFATQSQTLNEQMQFARAHQKPITLVQIDNERTPKVPALNVIKKSDPQEIVTSLLPLLTKTGPTTFSEQNTDILELTCPHCHRVNIYKLQDLCNSNQRIIFRKSGELTSNARVRVSCQYCYQSFIAQNIDCSGC